MNGTRVHYLFIAGCQRSGTTALLRLMNSDQRIILGRERYKRCLDTISPASFEHPRFFHPRPEETNYCDEGFYRTLLRKWQKGGVLYVGDKTPFYYKVLPHLWRTFDDFKVLYLVRDLNGVAASYNARAADPEDRMWNSRTDYRQAVRDWNESLLRLQEFVRSPWGKRVFIVRYEDFFCGDKSYLESLYAFLALDPTPTVRGAFRALTRNWPARLARPCPLSDEMLDYLSTHRNRDLESWCLEQTESGVRNQEEGNKPTVEALTSRVLS